MDNTFIDLYLNYTKDFESPASFWKWSAYAAISGVLRDNCYRREPGDSRLYPNIYILLLAPSGIHRKGRPVKFANKLVEKIGNNKIISGRTSVQAILKEMHSTETDPITGRIAKGGSAIFFAEELAAGLVGDEQQVSILTDIYDWKEKYRDNLASRELRIIQNVVFGLFAGSNEELLKKVFTDSAIYGGLLGRTFLVTPDEFRKGNSLTDDVDEKADDTAFLILLKSLERISSLKGVFKFTQDGADEYNNWYHPFRESLKVKSDRSGVLARMTTGVIKLAMILAANELTLSLSKYHINKAITECVSLLPNYNTFTMMSSKTDDAAAMSIILKDLLDVQHHTRSRKILIQIYWSQGITGEVLDRVMLSFVSAGLVKDGLTAQREVFYTLTDHCLKVYNDKGE